jgi:hypothetical protein
MPEQHVKRLWDQCFASNPGIVKLLTRIFTVVPDDALNSATFCFSVALTQQRAVGAALELGDVYAVSR